MERRYPCNQISQVPDGAVFPPSLLARARSKSARIRLVVSDDVLAHLDADGDGHAIPWPEIEAALPALDGTGLRRRPQPPRHRGPRGTSTAGGAVETVRARIPQERWMPLPGRTDAGEYLVVTGT